MADVLFLGVALGVIMDPAAKVRFTLPLVNVCLMLALIPLLPLLRLVHPPPSRD